MIDDNITAATCEFGLAQTDGGACDVTFASFDPDSYLRSQIIYLAVGVLSVAATGFMYWRAVRFDCAKLQQYSLLLSAYASLTFVLRSADPNSYRHKIPHPVVCFFSDSCTAALYSVFILSLSYWASVIQRGAAHIQRPLELACFEAASIALVWLFYLAVDMLLFTTKGFFKPVMTYVQMGGSAGVLTLIGAAFLVYGVRVRNRLCHFERQKQLFEQRHLPYPLAAATQHLDPSNGSEPIDDNKELRRRRRASVSNSHAAKIVKILVVVDTLVVLAVGAQLYTAIARTTTRNSERDCANGFNCEDVRSSVNLMHWFQLAAIWVIVWLFRKIDKRTETPGTP